jgi:hypothetical protein
MPRWRGNPNESVTDCLVFFAWPSKENEVNKQVSSYNVAGETQDWRIMPWNGAVLIVKELNQAIEAREFDLIKPQPEGNALDFSFGERVFRIVLRTGIPASALTSGRHIENPDVLLVLSRRDIQA